MAEQPAGPIIDALGVVLDLDEGQQVTEVLIVAKVVDFGDGGTALVLASNDGLDWVAQHGLVAAAQYILNQGEAERE